MQIVALILLLPALALSQTPEPIDINDLLTTVFQILDDNSDNHIARHEIDIFFQQHDENFDGLIEKNEFIDAVNAHSTGTNPAHVQLIYNIYPFLDIDSDNFVDHHDLDQLYLRADADKNGQVTLPEFEVFLTQLLFAHGFDKYYEEN
ncbi:uncharacterized protein LOC131947712 [Physella acuta]|uniref:uncharacterized protein LOC131947712 n=1 Tax=Physella acuta TaxID=109671 RepID=UPI0027DDD565|nr:uncharacterized protein LOC131947712 [Physella acuta]XP_059164976.1 uncharacterized protein LOC131947712 [Physella acuta]